MKLVFDVREAHLHDAFMRLEGQRKVDDSWNVSSEMLPIGDILLCDETTNEQILVMERKSIPDLLASIKDGRYKEQSYRLIHSTNLPRRRIVYIIEGVLSQFKQEKSLIHSAILSLSLLKGFTVLRTSSVQETAELLFDTTRKLKKELESGNHFYQETLAEDGKAPPVTSASASESILAYQNVVKAQKKENITPSNITEIMLCQIPGISHTISSAITQKFPTMKDLIIQLTNDPTCLDGLQYECKGKQRKVNKQAIQNINEYLMISA